MNVDTWEATSNYFELLGVRAARGRLFNEGDRGRERLAAVLSHSAWMRYFGGTSPSSVRPSHSER